MRYKLGVVDDPGSFHLTHTYSIGDNVSAPVSVSLLLPLCCGEYLKILMFQNHNWQLSQCLKYIIPIFILIVLECF